MQPNKDTFKLYHIFAWYHYMDCGLLVGISTLAASTTVEVIVLHESTPILLPATSILNSSSSSCNQHRQPLVLSPSLPLPDTD